MYQSINDHHKVYKLLYVTCSININNNNNNTNNQAMFVQESDAHGYTWLYIHQHFFEQNNENVNKSTYLHECKAVVLYN